MKKPSTVTEHILTLLNYKGWGSQSVLKATRLAKELGIDLFKTAEFIRPLDMDSGDFGHASDRAKRICVETAKYNIQVISILDPEYPTRLATIPEAPPVLYIYGCIDALYMPCIAIVGTRKPSTYGRESAFRISRSLSAEGICIVSGLAIGIDTAVHEGALSSKGKTIAVLAHGLDSVHPQRNSELAIRIVQTGGALVSEHPPGTRIFKTEFIRRNRIQSGLSACSLVVESGRTGGSIRQAEFTYKQGRGLFVIMPKHISISNSDYDFSGSHYLVEKYNAKVIYDKNDLSLLQQCLFSEA